MLYCSVNHPKSLTSDIDSFDTLVLTDVKEKDGSLLNNLEFPIYFSLFVINGLAQGKRLNLVGEQSDISQVMRLLRFTLFGPTQKELDTWGTDAALKKEWLGVSEAIALKDKNQETIPLEDFFNLCPFEDSEAKAGKLTVRHLGTDNYQVENSAKNVNVNLNQDHQVQPCYEVQSTMSPATSSN